MRHLCSIQARHIEQRQEAIISETERAFKDMVGHQLAKLILNPVCLKGERPRCALTMNFQTYLAEERNP